LAPSGRVKSKKVRGVQVSGTSDQRELKGTKGEGGALLHFCGAKTWKEPILR